MNLDSTRTSSKGGWAELSGYYSSANRLPFWLHSNQWGIVPKTGSTISIRAGYDSKFQFSKDSSSNASKWSLNYGAEVIGNINQNSKLILPQAYLGISYKNWEFSLGRRRQLFGIVDSPLSSGSYVFSGNALPLPKIQLSVLEYTRLPLTGNLVYFKGYYSDGWFETGRPVTSELKLHNKSLYLRIGKPRWKIKLHGGFNHAVQWGGKSPYLTLNGQMPKGLKNYWYVITGFKPKDRVDLSNFDQANRIGNHLGSLDVAVELDFSNINIMFYRQNLIEDGSLFYLNNIKDGLNGITIRRKTQSGYGLAVKEFTLEVLYTKSQGGTKVEQGSNIRGNDDYYNNGQVRDGWSYLGRSIGTPFISPASDNTWPAYADFFTNNNRVWVLHGGLSGSINRLQWTSKLSYSSNQGTYGEPFGEKVYQFSGILSVSRKMTFLDGIILGGSVAVDNGQLLKNCSGLSLFVRKEGLFSRR